MYAIEMNIAICTLAIGDIYKQNVSLASRCLQLYADKHGYTIINDDSIVEDREFYWNKILLLQKYLPEYDYLVWIDADIMIMNHEIKLEYLIFYYLCNKDILMSIDPGNMINTGFWILRNSKLSSNILSMIYNLPELAGQFHEQGAFNQLYQKNVLNIQNHCQIIPEHESRLCNASMYTYQPGDFLIHFLGIHVPHLLAKVNRDFYPFQKPHEPIAHFEDRKNWISRHTTQFFNARYVNSAPKIKIGVCTLLIGDKYSESNVKYGISRLSEYCIMHGYQLIIEHEVLDDSLPPHFSKMLLMLKHIDQFDYIIWFDADIMIMNETIKFEDLIYKYGENKDFMLCREIMTGQHINTGVWVARNTDYAKDVLKVTHLLPELRDRKYEDQDVWNQLYNRNILNLQDHCAALSPNLHTIMNCCVGYYKWGMFAIHFMSLSAPGLHKAFNDYYPKRRDDENEDMYQYRLAWLKKH
jgi:lipopolysaccharide biosynthesis glycosyltransferase